MSEWAPDDPRLTPVLLRRELLAEGMNDKAIARAVASGVLHRARYGSYVDATAWAACDDLGRHSIVARSVFKRANADMVASHLTAAVEWETPLWDFTPEAVHTTRPDGRAGRREAGVVQHLGELREQDITTLNGLRVTAPARTALDCASLLGVEHGMAVAGDFLHRGLITHEVLADTSRHMSQWPGSLRHQLVTRLADGRCESVGEHRTLHLCWKQGLPAPHPQFEIVDASGRVVARVDFAWPDRRVWLEFDGRTKYQELLRDGEDITDVVLREKRREKEIRDLTGWECIRITWADLYRPTYVAAEIRKLFNSPDTAAG